MRGKYIIVTLAITCGAGAVGWRAANQISLRIQGATHLARMAQLNVEEKAKAARLAQGTSETAERFAGKELALERHTREAVEQALDIAVNRTAQAARILAEQDNVTKNFEGDLADAEVTKEELFLTLAAQSTTKKAIEPKLNDLYTILHLLDERILNELAARRQVQAELDVAKIQVRNLSSQLQQVTTAKPRTTRIERRITSRSMSRRPQTWW